MTTTTTNNAIKIQSLSGIEFNTNCSSWAAGVIETPYGDIVASTNDYDADLSLNREQVQWLVDRGCTTYYHQDDIDHACEVTLPDGRNLESALNAAMQTAESELLDFIQEAIAGYIYCVGLAAMLRYTPAPCEQYRDYYDDSEQQAALEWANDHDMLSWDFVAKTVTLTWDDESQVESFDVVAEQDNCSSQISMSDFSYYDETLCRLRDGAYIVIGSGGPRTRWSQSCEGGGVMGGRGIIVPTSDELEIGDDGHLAWNDVAADQ